MILNVCVNPRIEVNLEVNKLSIGRSSEIINKNTFYTGRAINVATGLARLGAPAFATGFMYEDNGRLFELQLHKEGIPYKFVWSEGKVKESFKFIDNKSMLTEFYEKSKPVSLEKQTELLNLISELVKSANCIVISGSIPNGISSDYFYKILQRTPNNVIKVVDAEGDNLLNALKCGADLIKPNLEELQKTLNVKIESKNDLLSSCEKLLLLGAKRVLVSLGKNGALITDGNKTYYAKSINVAMNSTVGAGDGMVAGATNALVNGENLKNILKSGVAAGTAAVTLPESISFTKNKYEEILSNLTVQEI
ncbi:MAG: hexose kinase [Clostridia bacterium]|nr:hexose kinase [Clostridia bacterium]